MYNSYMATLERAIEIAVEAHKGQVDKVGEVYILHPLRLMLKMKTATERSVAVLHDVVEDSHWTLDDLRKEGFSEEIISAVDSLTKREAEDYQDFVKRASRNPLGRAVKIADIEDNMDLSRFTHPTAKDHARNEKKYKPALALLRAGE